jgi:ABC-type nitrate/sulfonate/bicarbonate transport system substrate-binding protein
VKTVLAKSSCRFVLVACFIVCKPVLAAQSGQLANVTIAYTSISPQYAPFWIAKEAGFFRKNGVNAQLVYMRGGVIATQALISNDVNFINAGGGGVVDAVLGGADIVRLLAQLHRSRKCS